MKIRNGFVSNSSSSSFIVKHKSFMDAFHKRKPRLTDDQIKLLEEHGFFKVNHSYPSKLEDRFCGNPEYKTDQDFEFELHYGFYVFCNQGEVITWLLENKIPFKAAINYSHEHVFWEGGPYMIVADNFGSKIEMYGSILDKEDLDYMTKKSGIRKVNVKKYLKGEAYV